MTRAMILAAGRGERMGALTTERPKPLLSIGHETLIERHVRLLVAAGVERIVVNLSYRGQQIRALLGDGARYDARIDYSSEGEPPLETGGGIIHALRLLGNDPFVVVNADVVSDYSLSRLVGSGLSDGRLGRLVLVPNPVHHPQGDFGIDADANATLEEPLLTFSGISLLDPALFRGHARGRQPLKPILDTAIRARRMAAEVHHGLWVDVGTAERLGEATGRVTSAQSASETR